MNEILTPVIVLGGTGLAMGLFLAFAAKAFEIKSNPKIGEVVSVLPGANCGGCGYAGCNGYATAIVEEGAKMSLCAPGGPAVAAKIGKIMGASVDVSGEKNTARVLCQGDKVGKKYNFVGSINTCADLVIYAKGDKLCNYSCLGYGDCAKVCPVGAIKVGNDGIAKVDEEKCISCGLCVKACPKHVITLTPASKKVTVTCSSNDKGVIAKQACETACIGCGICAKNCPKEAITVTNNLAKIDPSKCVNCGICATKCPTHAIVNNFKRPNRPNVSVPPKVEVEKPIEKEVKAEVKEIKAEVKKEAETVKTEVKQAVDEGKKVLTKEEEDRLKKIELGKKTKKFLKV